LSDLKEQKNIENPAELSVEKKTEIKGNLKKFEDQLN
jgi:hypothetical protein